MNQNSWPKRWGYFGNEPPCNHLIELRSFLETFGLDVYSEHGEPDRWVNVHCQQCHKTYEVSFRIDLVGESNG